MPPMDLVTPEPWDALRRYTDARIALGRAGHSLPTQAHLQFQLAHAMARDAVHFPFDAQGLACDLEQQGHTTLLLRSAAASRNVYLPRPDFGRRLDVSSRQRLKELSSARTGDSPFDLSIVVADGLSAQAVNHSAAPLIAALCQRLRADETQTWTLAPIAIVEQGRVAVADEVGELMGARAVVVLLGERPGLSSPDSMGMYLSWSPRVGLTDAQRNCISNVRPAGLSIEDAADKLFYLLRRARDLGLTGVGLKDESVLDRSAVPGNPGEQRQRTPWLD